MMSEQNGEVMDPLPEGVDTETGELLDGDDSQATERMSIDVLLEQREYIDRLRREVMIEGQDYGSIDGVPKPFLFKPGAEKICVAFRYAPEIVTDCVNIGEDGHAEYVSTCTLRHIPTGTVICRASGSCTTMEKRYRWRGRGTNRYENPDIADQRNTCRKMSEKRSLVAAVLIGTAASHVFVQDEDYVQSNMRNDDEQHRHRQQPVNRGGKHSAPPPPQAKAPAGAYAQVSRQQGPKGTILRATLTPVFVAEKNRGTGKYGEWIKYAATFAELDRHGNPIVLDFFGSKGRYDTIANAMNHGQTVDASWTWDPKYGGTIEDVKKGGPATPVETGTDAEAELFKGESDGDGDSGSAPISPEDVPF